VSIRRSVVAALVATVMVGGAGAASTHAAAAKPKSYKDCKALNRDYPHGVGRKNARDKTSGERVTNFKRSNRLYAANDGKSGAPPAEYDLDRDNDGIACEQL
jgi:hypothetical protein